MASAVSYTKLTSTEAFQQRFNIICLFTEQDPPKVLNRHRVGLHMEAIYTFQAK